MIKITENWDCLTISTETKEFKLYPLQDSFRASDGVNYVLQVAAIPEEDLAPAYTKRELFASNRFLQSRPDVKLTGTPESIIYSRFSEGKLVEKEVFPIGDFSDAFTAKEDIDAYET